MGDAARPQRHDLHCGEPNPRATVTMREGNVKTDAPLTEYWKVPFRMVYCDTFRAWLAETIYCHVCLRIDPPHPLPFGPKSNDDYEGF